MRIDCLRRFVFLAGVVSAGLAMAAVREADPAVFGLSPEAEPSVNTAAMRRALDGGNCRVTVTKPGVYMLDGTVFLDDNTELDCVPGVVFRRAKAYPNMFVNRGAYDGKRNENIVIRNAEISINGFQGVPSPDTKCYGLRGNMAFFRVRNVQVYGFRCRDMEAGCYAIHFADFDGAVLDGFEILGKKDGVHINGGRNFIVRNGLLRTGDDGIALNASDWPSSAPNIGSIENGLVENVVDLEGGKCNFVRILTGAVPEWHEGIVLRRGEPFRVDGRRIYFLQMPVAMTEYVSKTKPTHTRGVWTSPEGLKVLYMQDDGCRTMDIRNVVFRNITMLCNRGGFTPYMDDNSWARSLHPEVPAADIPHTRFTVENLVSYTKSRIIGGNGNLDLTLKNIRRLVDSPMVSRSSFNGRPVTQRVRVVDSPFPEGWKSPELSFSGRGIRAEVLSKPLPGEREIRVSTGDEAVVEVKKAQEAPAAAPDDFPGIRPGIASLRDEPRASVPEEKAFFRSIALVKSGKGILLALHLADPAVGDSPKRAPEKAVLDVTVGNLGAFRAGRVRWEYEGRKGEAVAKNGLIELPALEIARSPRLLTLSE